MIGINIDLRGLEIANHALDLVESIGNNVDLFELIGSEVESQTRRRIQEEKTGPDGKEWKPWSKKYAASQHGNTGTHAPHPDELRRSGGHSLLQLDGGLLDSIQYQALPGRVLVGSNLVYAGPNQASRPFLGVSRENEDEIESLCIEFIRDLLK